LRWQWTLAGVLLCSACVLGGFLVFSRQLEARTERWMAGRALAITRMLAQTLSSSPERGEVLATQRQLELLAALPEADFGVLLGEEGTPLAAWNPELAPRGPWPDATQELLFLPTVVVARLPVRTRGGVQGTLLVGLDRARLEHEGGPAWRQAALAALVLWGFGVGSVFGLGLWLMRPLERLTRTVRRLAEGEGSAREALEPSAPDEPGLLSAAVERVVAGVHAQVDLLDALVGEARGYQERLHVQHRLLDAQSRELLQVRAQLVAERLGRERAPMESPLALAEPSGRPSPSEPRPVRLVVVDGEGSSA
jgi:HAMP domain-containing protein